MPYTQNPHIPKLRAKAVLLVRSGWSIRKVSRHIGVHPSTVCRWRESVPEHGAVHEIPTKSSRPHCSPGAVDASVVERIVALRQERGRCAEVLHAQLVREGVSVSLSTVKRTLARKGLVQKKSPWKKVHISGERPVVESPGILVEMDSVHLWRPERKDVLYVVTLVDVFSRWAHAKVFERLGTHNTLQTLWKAQQKALFSFSCIQTDHGSEFSKHFTTMVEHHRMRHRHTRVRTPNDNAHVERFNRTVQEEMRGEIQQYRYKPKMLNQSLQEYMEYYNTKRLHMGIHYKTPMEVVDEVLRRY